MSTAFDCAVDTFVRDLIWRGKYGVRGAKLSKPSLLGSSNDNVASARVLEPNHHNMPHGPHCGLTLRAIYAKDWSDK